MHCVAKFDSRSKKFKTFKICEDNLNDGKPFEIDIGYEAFLGPELFFNPEIYDQKWKGYGVAEMVDKCIQGSPIDCRRDLYTNIVISGGSTGVKNFRNRLKKDIQSTVDKRLEVEAAKWSTPENPWKPKPIKIEVSDNPFRYCSVWHGASMFSSSGTFVPEVSYKTRE